MARDTCCPGFQMVTSKVAMLDTDEMLMQKVRRALECLFDEPESQPHSGFQIEKCGKLIGICWRKNPQIDRQYKAMLVRIERKSDRARVWTGGGGSLYSLCTGPLGPPPSKREYRARCAWCVYWGYSIDLPTYFTRQCMCFQAVQGMTIACTLLRPVTVSTMSFSWLRCEHRYHLHPIEW